MFLGKESIVLLYIDDCIIINRCDFKVPDNLIKSLKECHEKFDFTDDGNLEKYLGVDAKRHTDGRIQLTQTHLIQRFSDVIGMDVNEVSTRKTPAIKPLFLKS